MTGKTLLMALGVGVVFGLILGISLVGLIGGANQEQAAPPTPTPRTVTVQKTVEKTVEKTVPAPEKTPLATTATATATATPTPTATPSASVSP
jgi:cytoskeletal protein RodZ